MKLIYIHIPKTGGGTFRSILKKHFYVNSKNRLSALDASYYIPERNYKFNNYYLSEKVFSVDECFASHIRASKFKSKENVFISWIRDPVERVISHYYHAKRFVDNPKVVRLRNDVQLVKDKNLSLLEFAKVIPNVMSFYLGQNINRYAFIGITEKYDESLKMFYKMFNKKEDYSYNKINVGTNRKWVSKKTRSKIEKINQYDMELYTKVYKEMFGEDI